LSKKKKHEVVISLIPILVDNRYEQTNPNHLKILVSNKDTILTKSIGLLHTTINQCLMELYNEHFKIDYEWSEKTLVNCRKGEDKVELTYTTNLLYMKDCNKKGQFINITEFSKLISDQYYVESISGDRSQFR
jgi:hypothetical protein